MKPNKIISVLAVILSLAAACQKPDGPTDNPAAAPKLVSSNPDDGATDLTGESLVLTLTFDVNVKCTSPAAITAGDAAVDKVTAFDKDVKINLSNLSQGNSYTVNIPAGTISGFNNNPAGEIHITFTMKDKDPDPTHYKLSPVSSLCNPSATSGAKKVYNFLLEQSGKKTLSGAMAANPNTTDFADYVSGQIGNYPALAGFDFMFVQYSPTPAGSSWVQDYNDISAASNHWKNNGLVSYMWHWNVPSTEADWKKGLEKNDFSGYSFSASKTSFDINAALTPGTWQNDFIMKDIEEVAGYLKNLQNAGIPIIWRPLHEAAGNYDLYSANGAWFWWGKGGAEPCKKLWRLLYDQFVNVHGLNNLIWVWTVDATVGCEDQYEDWYPGDDVVDIVGVDIYENNTDAKTRQFQALVDVTKGKKLVTISECGNIPSPDACFAEGNAWSWFMVWNTTDKNGNLALSSDDWALNTKAWWTSVMKSSNVINREDMPSLK
ncbi:MAG: glycosyl hydrolase [Candidatus Cryptobacteroides sp.]